jgi:hypothetical protein
MLADSDIEKEPDEAPTCDRRLAGHGVEQGHDQADAEAFEGRAKHPQQDDQWRTAQSWRNKTLGLATQGKPSPHGHRRVGMRRSPQL